MAAVGEELDPGGNSRISEDCQNGVMQEDSLEAYVANM